MFTRKLIDAVNRDEIAAVDSTLYRIVFVEILHLRMMRVKKNLATEIRKLFCRISHIMIHIFKSSLQCFTMQYLYQYRADVGHERTALIPFRNIDSIVSSFNQRIETDNQK